MSSSSVSQLQEKPGRAPASPWRIAYRILRWMTLGGAVLMLLLLFHKVSPPAVQQDSRAGERLEAKLQQLDAAAAAGQPQTLRLDEAELNAYLGSHLAMKPDAAATQAATDGATQAAEHDPTVEEVQSTVRDVKINLVDDRVHAYIVFDFHGKDMSLQLEGRLSAEEGYVRFDPTGGQIGSLPIPQSTLESAVRKMMGSAENREKLRLPPEIRDLRIENGEVVVSYR